MCISILDIVFIIAVDIRIVSLPFRLVFVREWILFLVFWDGQLVVAGLVQGITNKFENASQLLVTVMGFTTQLRQAWV